MRSGFWDALRIGRTNSATSSLLGGSSTFVVTISETRKACDWAAVSRAAAARALDLRFLRIFYHNERNRSNPNERVIFVHPKEELSQNHLHKLPPWYSYTYNRWIDSLLNVYQASPSLSKKHPDAGNPEPHLSPGMKTLTDPSSQNWPERIARVVHSIALYMLYVAVSVYIWIFASVQFCTRIFPNIFQTSTINLHDFTPHPRLSDLLFFLHLHRLQLLPWSHGRTPNPAQGCGKRPSQDAAWMSAFTPSDLRSNRLTKDWSTCVSCLLSTRL